MANPLWIILNDAKLKAWQKKIDLDLDTLKLALVTSTSNISATMSPSGFADLTHEVAAANGYPAGGETVASQTLSGGAADSFVELELADVTFTASGGNIVARWVVLYDDDATDKDIVAFGLIDAAGGDYTIVPASALVLQLGSLFREF